MISACLGVLANILALYCLLLKMHSAYNVKQLQNHNDHIGHMFTRLQLYIVIAVKLKVELILPRNQTAIGTLQKHYQGRPQREDARLHLEPSLRECLHICFIKIYGVLDKFVSTLCFFDKTELRLHGRLNLCD